MPEFPYESDFIAEIESCILKYGGPEGLNLLKEHAMEAKDTLESSLNQNFQTPEKSRLQGWNRLWKHEKKGTLNIY
jgi:hypothetical protein